MIYDLISGMKIRRMPTSGNLPGLKDLLKYNASHILIEKLREIRIFNKKIMSQHQDRKLSNYLSNLPGKGSGNLQITCIVRCDPRMRYERQGFVTIQ